MKAKLVIGSEGFIGKPFCNFLEKKGEKVIHFDLKRDRDEDGRFYQFNFEEIDTVYFLAWDVGGSKYIYDPKLQKQMLDGNLQLMSNVFHQIEVHKPKFLFVSSQLAEECDTVYGVTKKLGEVWTGLLHGISVRVWNAYGVMEENNIRSHVISDFIYQALNNGKIQMMTKGEEWRQFTHITDLSNAFYLSLNTPNLSRKVYDACSYEWVQIKDVAQIIGRIVGVDVYPGSGSGYNPPPASNMGRLPGWLPRIDLYDGLKNMINEAHHKLKK